MALPRSNTAAKLAKRWNLNVGHALYRKTGDWYHQLKRFPGALIDADGYVLFETEVAYRECPQLRIRKDVAVHDGIKSIPGYTPMSDDEDSKMASISYEATIAFEGSRMDVLQSRPERNPALRVACLEAHGYTCAVCNIDFGERYGPIGQGFIHVHHLRPLAEGERVVNPVADLRPLCPNCHAMAHRKNPPYSIDELKTALRSS